MLRDDYDDGLIIVALLFFIMAYIKEGCIGGGDVKLMVAIGFFMGIIEGVNGSIFSLIFGIAFMIAISRFKEISGYKHMMLVPFSAFGYLLFI